MSESFNITLWLVGGLTWMTGVAVSLLSQKRRGYNPFSPGATVRSVVANAVGIAGFAALAWAGSPQGSALAETMHDMVFVGPVFTTALWLAFIRLLRGIAWEGYRKNGRVYPGASMAEVEAWGRSHGKLREDDE